MWRWGACGPSESIICGSRGGRGGRGGTLGLARQGEELRLHSLCSIKVAR